MDRKRIEKFCEALEQLLFEYDVVLRGDESGDISVTHIHGDAVVVQPVGVIGRDQETYSIECMDWCAERDGPRMVQQ